MALLQAEPAAERNVADVGNLELGKWRQSMDVMVGPDALDPAHGAWSEPGAGPVGDAEIHWHTRQSHVQAAEVGLLGRAEVQWSV
jgi:hypothetical protein